MVLNFSKVYRDESHQIQFGDKSKILSRKSMRHESVEISLQNPV